MKSKKIIWILMILLAIGIVGGIDDVGINVNENYILGEEVVIETYGPEGYASFIRIIHKEEIQEFNSKELKTVALELGKYDIEVLFLINGEGEILKASYIVEEEIDKAVIEPTIEEPVFELPVDEKPVEIIIQPEVRGVLELDDEVIMGDSMLIKGVVDQLVINHEQGSFAFLGEIDGSVKFKPPYLGEYFVEGKIEDRIIKKKFRVVRKIIPLVLKMRDKLSKVIDVEQSVKNNNDGTKDVQIKVTGKKIKEVNLNKVSGGNYDIRIADLEADKFNSVKAFAIDPSEVDFIDGELISTAKGNLLLKCKEWDFENEICLGEWKEIMKINPGQDYSIELSPDDPAFIEIFITKAMHLDSNRTFIKDVYDYVKARDFNYTLVNDGEYIRVEFEVDLDSSKDITIYAKSNSSGKVEVYEENGTNKIAEFSSITNDGKYRILLTNLNGSQNTFDLKIVNSVEVDYIVDPTLSPLITINYPSDGEWYKIEDYNISLNATIEDPENNPLDILVFVDNDTSIGKQDTLVYRKEDSANTSFNYNLTSLPIDSSDPSLVLLMHLDNRSEYGESNIAFIDYSNGGNDGICGDACPIVVVNDSAKMGGSILFDNTGTDDAIRVSDSASLDSASGVSQPRTFSIWYKPTDSPTPRLIFDKSEFSGDNYYLWSWGNYLEAGIDYSGGNNVFTPGSSIVVDQWYHIAFTFNGTWGWLYLDGILVDNSSMSGIAASNDDLNIGARWYGDNGVDGYIDDFAIWNRSLSEEEILNIYRLQNGSYNWIVNSTDSNGYSNVSEQREINIGEQTGNQIIFNNIGYNISGSNDGELSNETSYSTSQFLNISHDGWGLRLRLFANFSNSLVDLRNITIESNELKTVVNLSEAVGIGANHTLYLPNKYDEGLYVCPDANQISEISVSCSNKIIFTHAEVSSGTWINGVFGYIENGMYAVMNLTGTGGAGDSLNPRINFTYPSENNGSTINRNYAIVNLSIEEGGLETLTYEWNKTNYTFFDESLILMFNFNNVSSLGENNLVVMDLSAVNNTILVNGSPIVNGGKYESGIEGTGSVAHYVEVSNFTKFPTTNITVAFWINSNTADVGRAAFSYATETSNNEFLIFDINSLTIYRNTTNTNTGIDVADNTWHHVVVKWEDSTNDLNIYVDGSNAYSGSLVGDIIEQNGCLEIGQEQDLRCGDRDSGQSLIGNMDEIMVWNRSLSLEEIKNLYFVNLVKYDSDKYYLYVNQSYNSTDGLSDGNYTFVAYATDVAGNSNMTEERIVTVDTSVVSFVSIDDCREINSSGDYKLSQDINSTGTCINITAANVNLNCRGYKINYSTVEQIGYGVYTNESFTNISHCYIEELEATDSNYAVNLESSNNTVYNNTILSIGGDGGINVNGDGNVVDANTLNGSGSMDAIYLQGNADYNNITNNWVIDSYRGIFLYSSNNDNNIFYNNITSDGYSGYGVKLQSGSSNNNFTGNRIVSSGENAYAMNLEFAENNFFSENRFNASDEVSIIIIQNNDIDDYFHTILDDNLVHGKPVNYSTNMHDFVFDTVDFSKYGAVIFVNSSNLTIKNSNFTKNGLIMYESDNSTVEKNNFSDGVGNLISIGSSDNVIVYNNSLNMTDGDAAIGAGSSYGNISNNRIGTVNTGAGISITGDNNYVTYNIIYASGSQLYMNGADNNTITNNYGAGGANGIVMDTSKDNLVMNSYFSAETAGSDGLYILDNSWNNTLVNVTLDSALAYGIYFHSNLNSLLIYESVINGPTNDIGTSASPTAGSYIKLYNVSFDETDVSISDDDVSLFNYNYLTVNVTREKDNRSMNNANVSVKNVTNVILETITNSSGLTNKITVLEFMQNSTGLYYDAVYYVNASAYLYNYSNVSINVSDDKILEIYLSSADTVYPSINYTIYTPVNDSNLNENNITIDVNASDSNLIYGFSNLDDSLYAWYRLDNDISIGESPLLVYDWSGNQRNGTPNDAEPTTSGKFGGGYTFAGEYSNNYITIGTDSNFSDVCVNGCTFSAWVYGHNDTQDMNIIGRYDSTSDDAFFYLKTIYTHGVDFVIGKNGSTADTCRALAPLNSFEYEKWNLVTGVYNGSRAFVYYNGEIANSTLCNFNKINETSWQDSEITYIGTYDDGSTLREWNGTIDEVLVFNKSFTNNEVRVLYNASLSRFRANYSLSDGQHTFKSYVVDEAGNMNSTNERSILVDTGYPNISFVNPTAANDSSSTGHIYVNVTLDDENDKYGFTNFDNSLVAWLRMDMDENYENESLVYDWSGNSNNGTVTEAFSVENGRFGGGYDFDGDDDYIELDNTAMMRLNKSFTISLWMNPRDISGGGSGGEDVYMVKGGWTSSDTATNNVFVISIGSDLKVDFMGKAKTLSMDFIPPLNQWSHVACTSNNVNVTCYVNGEWNASMGAGTSTPSFQAVYIGRSKDVVGDTGDYYDGILDEILFFNRSLNSSEIMALYNGSNFEKNFTNLSERDYSFTSYVVDEAGNMNSTEERTITVNDFTPPSISYVSPTPDNNSQVNESHFVVNVSVSDESEMYGFTDLDSSLVLWYRFDNDSIVGENNTHVYDWSGFGNNGSINENSTPTINGKFGGGFEFDGDGDDIDINDVSGIQNISGEITVSAWIYSRLLSSGRVIVSSYQAGGGSGWRWQTNSDFLELTNTGGLSGGSLITPSVLVTNKWQHVVFTSNGTNISAYLDGVLIDAIGGYIINSSGSLRKVGSSASRWFNGTMDEIMIFNRSLNSMEIIALYNATSASFQNNFTDLSNGNHTIKSYVVDSSGNMNSTGTRTITINSSISMSNIVITLLNGTWNNLIPGTTDNTIVDSLKIENLGNAYPESGLNATFITNVSNVYGLTNDSFIINASNFQLNNTYLDATGVNISIVSNYSLAPNADFNISAILDVPAGQTAKTYKGTILVSWIS